MGSVTRCEAPNILGGPLFRLLGPLLEVASRDNGVRVLGTEDPVAHWQRAPRTDQEPGRIPCLPGRNGLRRGRRGMWPGRLMSGPARRLDRFQRRVRELAERLDRAAELVVYAGRSVVAP